MTHNALKDLNEMIKIQNILSLFETYQILNLKFSYYFSLIITKKNK